MTTIGIWVAQMGYSPAMLSETLLQRPPSGRREYPHIRHRLYVLLLLPFPVFLLYLISFPLNLPYSLFPGPRSYNQHFVLLPLPPCALIMEIAV